MAKVNTDSNVPQIFISLSAIQAIVAADKKIAPELMTEQETHLAHLCYEDMKELVIQCIAPEPLAECEVEDRLQDLEWKVERLEKVVNPGAYVPQIFISLSAIQAIVAADKKIAPELMTEQETHLAHICYEDMKELIMQYLSPEPLAECEVENRLQDLEWKVEGLEKVVNAA